MATRPRSRLSDRERYRRALEKQQADRGGRHDATLEKAKRLWKAGKMVPWQITIALDAMGLEGPEVDVACGAKEPDVDQWESGDLYPTWEQVLALSKLTGRLPILFMEYKAVQVEIHKRSSLRFHLPAGVELDEPILAFKAEAINARFGVIAPIRSR